MRVRPSALTVVVLAFAVSACGKSGTAVDLPVDAAGKDAVGTRDAAVDLEAQVPVDVGQDDAGDAIEPRDVAVELEVGLDSGGGDVANDVPIERSVDVAPPKIDAAPDLKADLPAEKPPATASWTIAPGAMCTAAGVGCMDTGALGGYQVTASGVCGAASSVQLWFPGGQAAVATGTYAVKVASGILDVINMQAGMVGVLAERDEGNKHARYWGRAGTATVAAAGAGRRITLSGVSLREETSSVTATLAMDGTCP
jgi:hypothetical protein